MKCAASLSVCWKSCWAGFEISIHVWYTFGGKNYIDPTLWNMEQIWKRAKKYNHPLVLCFPNDLGVFKFFLTFSISVYFFLLSWKIFIFIIHDYLIQWKGW